MPKSRVTWPEIVFGGGSGSSRISRARSRGELRKIGPALYTSLAGEDPAAVIARHRWEIVEHFAPGAVVSHRTAFEGRPAADGTVFLTAATPRRLDLPGLRLRVHAGPGPLPGDQPFLAGLTLASEPRLLLENLAIARERQGARRTVTRVDLEARLDQVARTRGPDALNAIRDAARALAPALGAAREMALLDRMIGAMLGSRSAGALAGSLARSRAAGHPMDPERLERFELLARSLAALPVVSRPDPAADGPAFRTLAFCDAYFSNFIEGTEFEVEEARAIVFEGAMPAARPADAHDVLGTWRLVGDRTWLSTSLTGASSADGFVARLRAAHAVLVAGRPEVGPGAWKALPNRAGDTLFVEPALVDGTIRRGWEIARTLALPFQRAAMVMFAIAEVHPFTDGNGRVARAFLNSELVAGGERRIIFPTVFRDDYLGALRALTRQDHPTPYLLMLNEAQRFTHSVRWDSWDVARADLEAAAAFARPEPGVRLRIPRRAV